MNKERGKNCYVAIEGRVRDGNRGDDVRKVDFEILQSENIWIFEHVWYIDLFFSGYLNIPEYPDVERINQIYGNIG